MKKSLLDIQREVRELDHRVKDLSSSITAIYDEIDALRDDDVGNIDYEMIRVVSRQITFEQHPLGRLDDIYARKLYMEALLSLVHTDRGSDASINRLIFIQWILTQSKMNETLEDLYRDTFNISTNTFRDLLEFLPTQYRLYLVVDSLIVANICGQASSEVLNYVVNLCDILGVGKEQLRSLSIIAKGVLRQNLGRIRKEDLQELLSQSKEFQYYLNDKMLSEVLRAQRTVVVEAPDLTHRSFKWKVRQQAEVRKGELIATYRNGREIIQVKASAAGTLFQFRNNNINYGVISHESDNKNSIKAWTIQKG